VGLLLHALLYSIAGRAREVAPALWALAVHVSAVSRVRVNDGGVSIAVE
jgi:hypothetical protein